MTNCTSGAASACCVSERGTSRPAARWSGSILHQESANELALQSPYVDCYNKRAATLGFIQFDPVQISIRVHVVYPFHTGTIEIGWGQFDNAQRHCSRNLLPTCRSLGRENALSRLRGALFYGLTPAIRSDPRDGRVSLTPECYRPNQLKQ